MKVVIKGETIKILNKYAGRGYERCRCKYCVYTNGLGYVTKSDPVNVTYHCERFMGLFLNRYVDRLGYLDELEIVCCPYAKVIADVF